jgi:hypothetical protein
MSSPAGLLLRIASIRRRRDNIPSQGGIFRMTEKIEDQQSQKPAVTLPGKVQKIIHPADPAEPEKAQIEVEGADYLYREIRVENKLTDQDGHHVNLKPGAEVDVTIEADPAETVPASPRSKSGSK